MGLALRIIFEIHRSHPEFVSGAVTWKLNAEKVIQVWMKFSKRKGYPLIDLISYVPYGLRSIISSHSMAY